MPQLSLYAIAALLVTNLITGVLWRVAVGDLTELEVRGQVAQERADATAREQQRITEETAHGWQAAVDYLRAEYARRLRLAGRGQVPRLPDAATGLDALPADALPLAASCAETTLQLEALQDWITRQGAAQ